ncbi:hypothetical protein Y032_0159g3291 [Ancylostoma ceylanicum]|uniref:Uncharacterized protein n=1 Tax=Ancylostoma ceylanicum TaxID=53326 RepID=A0A016SYG9_9BILA|nr:hypothetical protein Y032_0159g3291 [Ancylostoma ceylanicum]
MITESSNAATFTTTQEPEYQYVGFSHLDYERIFAFKRNGTMPSFEEVEESKRKGKRSTFKHKCADFHISADGTTLMYFKVNRSDSKRKLDADKPNVEMKLFIVAIDHLTKWP